MKDRLEIQCSVCERQFRYGDEMSPMFDDQAWNYILNYFGIDEDARADAVGLSFFENFNDGHTYVCYKCAEKAFGRPLRLTDLNGSWFNVPFIMHYFGYSEKQAGYFCK